MAELAVLVHPDARLRERSAPVTCFDTELERFVADLTATLYAGPGGVGIAAPQVGRLDRIVILDCSRSRRPCVNHGLLVLVNPVITERQGQILGREGCMSVPEYTGNVLRAAAIEFDCQDLQGRPQHYSCTGFEARCVQHELDHLDGMLFIDRVVSRRSDLFLRQPAAAPQPAAEPEFTAIRREARR